MTKNKEQQMAINPPPGPSLNPSLLARVQVLRDNLFSPASTTTSSINSSSSSLLSVSSPSPVSRANSCYFPLIPVPPIPLIPLPLPFPFFCSSINDLLEDSEAHILSVQEEKEQQLSNSQENNQETLTTTTSSKEQFQVSPNQDHHHDHHDKANHQSNEKERKRNGETDHTEERDSKKLRFSKDDVEMTEPRLQQSLSSTTTTTTTTTSSTTQTPQILQGTFLPDELTKLLTSLSLKLKQQPFKQTVIEEELKVIHQHLQKLTELDQVCNILGLHEVNDDLYNFLCCKLLDDEAGYKKCISFIKSSLLPRVKNLQQSASRTFISTILKLGKQQPKAILDSLLVPIATTEAASSGSAQTEVVNRVVQECLPVTMVQEFLANILSYKTTISTSTSQFIWTEQTIQLLTNFINLKTPLTEQMAKCLILQLENNAELMETSLKFATFLFNVVSKYEREIKPHKDNLMEIAKRSDSFMAKHARTKLSNM